LRPPVRVVAHYFPQLYPIPENDAWWGKGFTDWDNVRRATPHFPGHYQPRVPAGAVYHDQSSVDVVRRQAELARAHGVDAFCHYHYWFDGKQLLSRPTDILLENREIDIQFCLAWANESWSRRWDGREEDVLITQTHPPTVESWGRHFEALIKYWLDERAMRVDGKPMFLIYRPQKIRQLPWMFEYFQTRAQREYGLPGIYFVSFVQHLFPAWEVLRHFDAAVLFQPFVATRSGGLAPTYVERRWWVALADAAARLAPRAARTPVARRLASPRVYDYDAAWDEILAFHPGQHLPVFQGAFVDWDNTARYRNRATIYQGATPAKFERYMTRLLTKVSAGAANERFVFINAWNEWAESAYLEPDDRYGLAYLQALGNAREAAGAV